MKLAGTLQKEGLPDFQYYYAKCKLIMNSILQITQDDLGKIISEIIEPLLTKSEEAIMASDGDRYLTSNQAMKLLAISRPTLWRLTHKHHKLTEYKILGNSRYKLSEIHAMMDDDKIICQK